MPGAMRDRTIPMSTLSNIYLIFQHIHLRPLSFSLHLCVPSINSNIWLYVASHKKPNKQKSFFMCRVVIATSSTERFLMKDGPIHVFHHTRVYVF